MLYSQRRGLHPAVAIWMEEHLEQLAANYIISEALV